MRDGTPQIRSLKRTLAMLDAVIADGGLTTVSGLARKVGLPIATAHRQVTTLVAEGYLTALPGGHHAAGARLLGLLRNVDEKQIVAQVAEPMLRVLATRLGCVVQLGTFENDMVTYRVKAGRGASHLFTRVDMQLEAYCSGIGKVLLANLPASERAAYLAGGPFVALTARTITDPEKLDAELDRVCRHGFAIDDGEIALDLHCIAVPLRNPEGSVIAAISVSRKRSADGQMDNSGLLSTLGDAVRQIEDAAFSEPQRAPVEAR